MIFSKKINNKDLIYDLKGHFFVYDKNTKDSEIYEYISKTNSLLEGKREEIITKIKEGHINTLKGISPNFINFYFHSEKDLELFFNNKELLENLKFFPFVYRFYIDYSKDLENSNSISNARLELIKNKINHIFLYYVGIHQEIPNNINGEYILKLYLGKDYDILFDKMELTSLKKYIDDKNIKGAEVFLEDITSEQLKEVNLLENTYQVLSYIMGNKIFKINILENFFNNTSWGKDDIKKYTILLKNYILSFIKKDTGYINLNIINDIEIANFFSILFMYNKALLHYTENEKTDYLIRNNFFNILYLVKNIYIKNDYSHILGFNGPIIHKIELVENLQELIINDKIISFIDENCLTIDKENILNNNQSIILPNITNQTKGLLAENYSAIYTEIIEEILKKIIL